MIFEQNLSLNHNNYVNSSATIHYIQIKLTNAFFTKYYLKLPDHPSNNLRNNHPMPYVL